MQADALLLRLIHRVQQWLLGLISLGAGLRPRAGLTGFRLARCARKKSRGSSSTAQMLEVRVLWDKFMVYPCRGNQHCRRGVRDIDEAGGGARWDSAASGCWLARDCRQLQRRRSPPRPSGCRCATLTTTSTRALSSASHSSGGSCSLPRRSAPRTSMIKTRLRLPSILRALRLLRRH